MKVEDSSIPPGRPSCKSDLDLIAALSDALGWALLVLDSRNQIRLANAGAASLLGFRLEEARAQDVKQVIKSKRLRRWLDQSIVDCSGEGSLLRLEAEADGEGRTVAVRCLSLGDKSDPMGCAILLETAKSVGPLEAGVDALRSDLRHEILTPLTSLRGFAELMLTRTFSEEKKREFLQIIHDETVRMTALLEKLLFSGKKG